MVEHRKDKEELEQRIAKIVYDVVAMDMYSIQVDAYDMAIEALQREEAEAKGYCHRIKPKGGDDE